MRRDEGRKGRESVVGVGRRRGGGGARVGEAA